MKNNKYLDRCVFYKEDTLEKYIISFFFFKANVDDWRKDAYLFRALFLVITDPNPRVS